MKTGAKLKSLNISHNMINVIPSSIGSLKFLTDFCHDWNLMFGKQKE